MAKRKVTAKQLLARAGSNGYERGFTERKTTLETAISTRTTPRRVKMRLDLYVL
jgi:hypothetical protein